MPEKIVIVKESGENVTSNVVSIFTVPETEKKYIITTENAVDPHGLTVLHVSEVKDGELSKISTEEEWSAIKSIMRAIISGNAGSYTYAPLLDKATASAQYSRDISVSASAEKQMVDNYAVGRKALPPITEATPTKTENIEGNNSASKEQTPPSNLQVQGGSSIFPQNTVVPTEDDEISPGIALIEKEQDQPKENIQKEETVSPVVENKIEPPVVPEAKDTISVSPANEDSVLDTGSNISKPSETITKQAAVAPMTTIQQVAMPAKEEVETKPELEPTKVETTQPEQTQPSNVITIDLDKTGSFAPNASLDEVVVASQNLFVDGVKNLVQSLTEKIYRDLRQKEVELNKREALLNEREKMLNDQLKLVMGDKPKENNDAEVIIPTVVEANNDEKNS